MLFPTHNPAQQAFDWYCRSNNITEANATSAAYDLRPHVSRIRKIYRSPIGHRKLPCQVDSSEVEFLV